MASVHHRRFWARLHQSPFVLGHGFSLCGNVSVGSAKYQTGANYPNGGKWVANTPGNIEGLNLLWQHGTGTSA